MCGLSTVVTPAGASLTMYREIRSYANSIWDDNNNNILALEKTDHSRALLHREYMTLPYGVSGVTNPLENYSCSMILPHCSI